MPYASINLFVLRITHSSFELSNDYGIELKANPRGIVAFTEDDGHGNIKVVDVIARDNFLDIVVDQENPEARIISSLGVRASGKPYVHRTRVFYSGNVNSLKTLARWKTELESFD